MSAPALPWLPWEAPALHAGVLAAALAWDRLLGEPPARLHPVVGMGALVRRLRRWEPRRPAAQLAFGGAMVATVVGLSAAAGLVPSLPGLPAWLALPLATWLLTASFATRGLEEAGGRVASALEAGDLAGARAGLGWLCSREAGALDASEVAAAAAESLAENSSDSLVAPLFWYAVAGLPGALAYRAANTLDAMVGYRGPTEWTGKAAARLDDLLNLLPARLAALLLLAVGAAARGASAARGLRVLARDRRRTASPNAGWPMAALAGLLGVRLEKPGHYVLGGEGRPCGAADLRRAVRLARGTMLLAAGLLLAALLGAALPRGTAPARIGTAAGGAP